MLVAIGLLSLLAACGGGDQEAQGPDPGVREEVATASGPTAPDDSNERFGMSVADLANAIGCTNIIEVTDPPHDLWVSSGDAICDFEGGTLALVTFPNAAEQQKYHDGIGGLSSENSYATAEGWVASGMPIDRKRELVEAVAQRMSAEVVYVP